MDNPKGINKHIIKTFPNFGVNKIREISRLVYEISRRENISAAKIINPVKELSFDEAKNILVNRRFPFASVNEENLNLYLPDLNFKADCRIKIKKYKFYPKNVFYEQKTADSFLLGQFKSNFPKARFQEIDSLKTFIKCRKFTLKDYNKRTDNFFITAEKYDYFKACPCTKDALCCGYNLLNIGYGCGYECTYCFLQEYQNFAGIILPANIKDFFSRVSLAKEKGIFPYVRLGTGEFTDSLIFDDVTEFSKPIIQFISKFPEIYFEFKTKSVNIDNILKEKVSPNIVVSWSLNPQTMINENEFYSASLKERLKAASLCQRAGFKVGFHFDPIIFYPDWQKDYQEAINLLFDTIDENMVAWISLGTFRFSPELKKVIESRFPKNSILNEELIIGFDQKLRYPVKIRVIMYQKIMEFIRRRSKKVFVYLCMEDQKVWKQISFK